MWELVGLIIAPFLAARWAHVDVGIATEVGAILLAATLWLAAVTRRNDVFADGGRPGYLMALPGIGLLLAAASAPMGAGALRYVGLFVGVWVLWLAGVRAVFGGSRPARRLIVIGGSPLWASVRRVSPYPVVEASPGPEVAGPHDLIVVDPRSKLDAPSQQWLSAMLISGRRAVSAFSVIEALTGRLPIDAVAREWSHALEPVPRRYLGLKRLLDVVGVVVLAPVVVPVSLVAAVAILMESGRPVLFVQDRIGKDGTAFRMLKFRTMVQEAEKDGAAFAASGDARVTRLGRFLRKYRIDELPQFWNVLKGEMSIIGPRPEQPVFVEDFQHAIAHYHVRHAVRPGITGWAQVHQGYAAGADETDVKLSYDLYYAKHVSAGLDAEIVARTVWTILTGFGAR